MTEAPDLPPIDMFALDQFLGGDEEFRARLCALLVETCVKDGALMRAAVEAGNHGAVAGIAHRLKGAAAAMFAPPLESACGALERAARRGEGDVPRRFASFEEELERLRQYLAA